MRSIKTSTLSKSAFIFLTVILMVAGSSSEGSLSVGSSLVRNSPFLPAGYHEKVATPEKKAVQEDLDPTRFVFKGVSRIGSKYFFSIYDSVSKKSEWIEAGIPHNGFSILKFEPTEQRVHFSWQGKEQTIQLVNPDGVPIPLVLLESPQTPVLPILSDANITSKSTTPGTRELSTRIAGLNRNQSVNREVASSRSEMIFFRQEVPSAISTTETLPGSQPILFAATDPLVLSSFPQELSITPTRRYQISRKNNVHNPSGKKPDHMTFAQWNALKQN